MVQNDEKQFAIVTKRLASLLMKDVENQGGNASVGQKFAAFQRDPRAWVAENLNPVPDKPNITNLPKHETRATIDWSKWVPSGK